MSTAPMPEDKPRVALVDLSSIYWAVYHATAKEAVSDAKNLTLQAVARIRNDYPGLIAICCDSREKTFRHALHPEYKAGRPERPRAAWEEFDRTKERLVADGLLLWAVPTFEADDVIATATMQARAHGHEVVICSADKDLCQLAGGGVTILRTHTWVHGGAVEVQAKFGVGPSQLGDWLALTGDDSDNIPGCPGCGPTKATQLLKKFTGLEQLFTVLAMPSGDKEVALALGSKNEKPWELVIIQNLKKSREAVMLARKLVTLREDVPICWKDIYAERKVQPLAVYDEPTDDIGDVSEDADTSFPPKEEAPAPVAASAQSSTVAPTPKEQDTSIAIGELVKMPQPKPETGLALVPQSFDRQLEPPSFRQALEMAKVLWNSRLYQKFGSPEAICAVVVRGREMGLPAGVSLDVFRIVEGGPCLTSNGLQVLAERLPECEWLRCTHTDDKYAEWETKHRRHPGPVSLRYTIEEAVMAGLCKLGAELPPASGKDSRNQWDKRRKNMLRKTARDNLIRMVYPGAGVLYSAEELGAEVDD
jgi:5'-3' exonuclease